MFSPMCMLLVQLALINFFPCDYVLHSVLFCDCSTNFFVNEGLEFSWPPLLCPQMELKLKKKNIIFEVIRPHYKLCFQSTLRIPRLISYKIKDIQQKDRSSRPEVFCKKDVLRNCAKLTGKHLCQSLFFSKSLRPAILLKKSLWHRCFPVNFAKFLRVPF